MDFLGPHFGGSPVELPQKISGEKIAFAAQQLYTKIKFRCFVVWVKKNVQKFGRKKRKKKRNEPHRGQKWVCWDEWVS